MHIPESRIRIRREHFPAPKNQTFFLLAIIRNIRMFCKTENRKQSRNAPILAIQVNMKWLCCWQFLWMNRPISMKTIFLNMCFYNHLPNTTSRYSRHFAIHKYSQKIRTQTSMWFCCWQLNSYTYLYRKRISPRFRKLFTVNRCVTTINSYYIRASMNTAAFST